MATKTKVIYRELTDRLTLDEHIELNFEETEEIKSIEKAKTKTYEIAVVEYEDSSNWWVCMPNTLENVLHEIKQHADDDDLQHYFTSVEIERTDDGNYIAIGYTKDKEEE